MSALPSGTVTFLFTDIEGSTQLLRQLRDRYREVIAAHGELLRAEFSRAAGEVIDMQGDAFFVAFRRARDAATAAAAAQQALAAYEWPEGGRVRVRMGVHTGEPEVAEARYVGLGVHRAAPSAPPRTEVRCSSPRRRPQFSRTRSWSILTSATSASIA